MRVAGKAWKPEVHLHPVFEDWVSQSVTQNKANRSTMAAPRQPRTYRRTLGDIGPGRGRANCRKVAGHGCPPRRDSERGKHRVYEDQGGMLGEKRRRRSNPGQIRSTWSLTRLLFPRRWHESLWRPGVSRSASGLSPVGPKTFAGQWLANWQNCPGTDASGVGFPPCPTSAELSQFSNR
jgi:hypothetical protein